jgi:hypothetical protein
VLSFKQKTHQARNWRIILQSIILSTSAQKTRFEKYRGIITAVVAISWVMGSLMFLFALIVLTLFIQLAIASAKEEIYLLITLGSCAKQLQEFLRKQFLPANVITVVVTLLVITALQFSLQKILGCTKHCYQSIYFLLHLNCRSDNIVTGKPGKQPRYKKIHQL